MLDTSITTFLSTSVSRSSQCSTIGIPNAMVCTILSMDTILLGIGKSSPCSGGSVVPLLLSGSLPYVRRHVTVNKMC